MGSDKMKTGLADHEEKARSFDPVTVGRAAGCTAMLKGRCWSS